MTAPIQPIPTFEEWKRQKAARAAQAAPPVPSADPPSFEAWKASKASPAAPAPVAPAGDAPGVIESAVRGAGEGFFGLGDNIEAGVKAMSPARTYVEELLKAKRRNREALKANPAAYRVGETVGLGVPVLGTAIATGGMGAVPAFATAVGTGALMGAGQSDGDPVDMGTGAALGAGGYAAGQVLGWGGTRLRDLLMPRIAARREVSQFFDPRTVQRALEQERLAPGTVVAADLSKQAVKSARPVGQAPIGRAAVEAENTAVRQTMLKDAARKVGAQYPANDTPVPTTPEVRSIMSRYWPKSEPEAAEGLGVLRKLRTEARRAGDAAQKRVMVGNEKPGDRELAAQAIKDAEQLTEAMKAVPGFAEVDAQYAIVAEARRGAARTAKTVADALGTGIPNRVMGNTPTSAGGHLTNGGSLLDRLHFLDAIKASNAAALADEALTPLTPKQIEALGKQYMKTTRGPGVGLMKRLLRQGIGPTGGLLLQD